ncbi:tRNA (N6-threonylcarbamoyladenosine(37)-N6)-methyltransferase TrmO [Alteromonas sp. a30]|uniref:tRNA (N6-threonylcarbamoyladenosine(37)-N6)-methyltransferase TrmO n=1 Tax=Alteromonas sp. a30 TaxID=2730917 RepID=UPI00227EE1AE|nr:tRNA (N6-threonylcarbamoyladenosine(37)-N6)-methyltransferase TrmO [Alteromonas sp. a30]MCY7295989.1 tRNA (N6-threonylcarbamoyladenosine(37)-N6)-methyltransferase TrmO [Alteromonas sp. a30]
MELTPIAYISTPYKEKFAIPRQPGLAPAVKGKITMQPDFNDINAFRGLEGFSHIWLIFQFHQVPDNKWTPLVRPPRLGGNKKKGVFATRSTHRPNNLGMSVVRLESISHDNGQVCIEVSGMDLLDGTPIFDIKPYIQYVDSLPTAQSDFAQQPPMQLAVEFSEQAQRALARHSEHYPDLEQELTQILSFNPCPAYQQDKDEQRIYGVRLYDFNVKWRLCGHIEVCDIETV